ncbi:hypothetical protein [Paucibacter sp. KCTC 42545]|uniref:hypothetical protein n=1 Tax=Paucibacter sp. KCTC 42545 TaxID=1768242 RepID=UPI000733A804|nr:hypothetical protein [Paucibacter sp. KCTC 42545]ALT79655.1 class III cytochrome C family protein [Paucibacter sp. KCTC 42545]
MKRPWLWWLIAANLLALLVLAFVYPHLMLGPGPLVPAHAELSTDCFACHAPLRGVSADRCMACHALADIGLRTSKGVAILAVPAVEPAAAARSVSTSASGRLKTAFHQELEVQNCMACHSDHAGPKLAQSSRKPFSHEMLREQTRERCEACHAAPSNAMHQRLSIGCTQCHKVQGWTPASFEHAALPAAELARCESCHKAPADSLHRQVKDSCTQCHRPEAWKPATFDHDAMFQLDGDHKASCETCHINKDYRRYTCFGCHEHTPANVRAEHEEEGIQDLQNCARCHRSADEEGGERQQGRSSGSGREKD